MALPSNLLELSCTACGFTEFVAVAPGWMRGDRVECPRCGEQAWAMAPSKVVDEELENPVETERGSEPKVIYRSSAPGFPGS